MAGRKHLEQNEQTLGLAGRIREAINSGAGKAITVLLAVAVLGGTAAWWVLRPADDATRKVLAAGHEVPYVCKNCQHAGTQRVAYDEPFPLACQKCQQKMAVLGFNCLRCRNIIEKQDKPVFSCPSCGFIYDSRIRAGGM